VPGPAIVVVVGRSTIGNCRRIRTREKSWNTIFSRLQMSGRHATIASAGREQSAAQPRCTCAAIAADASSPLSLLSYLPSQTLFHLPPSLTPFLSLNLTSPPSLPPQTFLFSLPIYFLILLPPLPTSTSFSPPPPPFLFILFIPNSHSHSSQISSYKSPSTPSPHLLSPTPSPSSYSHFPLYLQLTFYLHPPFYSLSFLPYNLPTLSSLLPSPITP
jgi:hypothetical protein